MWEYINMNEQFNPHQGPPAPAGLKLTPFRSIVMIIIVLAVAVAIILSDDETQFDPDTFDQMPQVDPKLVIYNEVEWVDTGLRKARGIAVGPNDSLYVAGDRSIGIFDAHGIRKSDIQLGGEPRCVAVADDGTIYVGMLDHVAVYEPGGVQKATWEKLGERALLTSIAVAGDDIVVADAGNRVVLCYDRAGTLVTRIGKSDPERNIPGVICPSPHLDVAIAADGLLRVSNPGRHKVEAYTVNGDLEFSWGKRGADIEAFIGCCGPTDLTILSDGKIVTSEKGVPRVKVYEDISGDFAGVVAAPRAFAASAGPGFGEGFAGFDLAVDSKDRVFVLDPAARAVRIFVLKSRVSDE